MQRSLAALVGLLLCHSTWGAAQTPVVAGSWHATFDQAIRTRGSTVLEVQRRGTAVLSLVPRGDSVFGTWVFPVGGGESRDSLVGTFRGDTLRLAGLPRIVTEGGGSIRVTLSLHGVLRDDRLQGLLFMQVEDREPAPRRWEAVRATR